jgi:thioredoxin 1
MNKFRFIILSILLFSNIFLQAQKSEKSSKYIYPILTSDSAFREAIAAQPITVVDFWAIWCKPCQYFLPEYEDIAKTLYKQAGFYKLDYDLCKATVEQYQVLAIPTIIIFKNGEEIKRYTGLTSKERIIADFKAIIE